MKINYRELKPVSKCPICEINQWAEHDNKPAIWPCGIAKCPYETPEQQAQINQKIEQSGFSSGIALAMEQLS